ncbi:MAG TPA: hypothetical protein VNU72_09050 [Puia sp.]|nr:hypothetical protein [Puia sp.]
MRTLICDLNVYDEGHHIAYVNSIMTFSADREDTVFLFNRKAADWCPGLKGDKRVFFVDEDFLEKNLKNVFLGKWREYKYIRRFAIQQAVDRVIFLEIDQYQAAIGMIPSPFHITGIYFRSFHKIGVGADSLPAMGRNALYHVKKRLLFQVMRLNRKVEPLFLLNDRSGNRRYPRWFNYLPDPVFPGPGKVSASSLRTSLQIPPTSHVFLVFGAMGARKNIQHIVDAYEEARLTGPSVLLVAGKVRVDYRQEFDRAVNGFIKDNGDRTKKLIVLDEFIDEDQVDNWFIGSDTIVLCYRKFYGSSGLMGIAARHGKTCIVPDQGLLYELCREYDLGYAANAELSRSISDAMSLSERNPVAGPGQRRFVNDHSENAFLTTLLR